MTGLIRSLWVLLIAIFVAGTLAVSATPLRAEPTPPMAGMAMTRDGQDCSKCDPKMDMMASCTLTCALSTVGVLMDQATLWSGLTSCRFDLADIASEGLAPAPGFIPPRTILIA